LILISFASGPVHIFTANDRMTITTELFHREFQHSDYHDEVYGLNETEDMSENEIDYTDSKPFCRSWDVGRVNWSLYYFTADVSTVLIIPVQTHQSR
jgi:hypothetical protein